MRPRRFRLALPKGEYLAVAIYPTRANFRAEAKLLAETVGANIQDFEDAEAACFGWREYQGGHRTKCVGATLFHQERLGGGVVSHEMTHAMFQWARAHKRASEEVLCILQGDLVAQFWTKYYKGAQHAKSKS